MVDTATVMLIVGIVSCLIGVFSFVSGLMTKSKQDGVLMAKVDACVCGIAEIKENAKENAMKQVEYYSKVDKLEVRVENLEKRTS